MSDVNDLKLAKQINCAFVASNNFFIALDIPSNYLEKTVFSESNLYPGTSEVSLDISPPLPQECYDHTVKKPIELKTS